ncbi:MAG: TetR/AcrR family transcriptional regulator [Flavobacterium sp.]|nr:TetR/AcrR family transcriptional regulator [Flavobacterium sp.]
MNPKERILEVATKLFYEQGYNNTGINQIIKDAEVAKASFYQYYPSKDDLLADYLTNVSRKSNEDMRSFIADKTDYKEKILSLFDLLELFVIENNFQGCNFLNVSAEIPKENLKVNAIITNQKNKIRNLISEVLESAGRQDIADEIYVLFDGAFVTSKVYNDVWPIKISKNIVKKLL